MADIPIDRFALSGTLVPSLSSLQLKNFKNIEMYLRQPFLILQCIKLDLLCGHCKSCWALELQVCVDALPFILRVRPYQVPWSTL